MKIENIDREIKITNRYIIATFVINGQDVLQMLDKHSMDKLKRQILNQK